MAFKFTNSKGKDYYLHAKTVKLRGSNKQQTIYFFAPDIRVGALNDLPSGYKPLEVQRTGMVVLKKAA